MVKSYFYIILYCVLLDKTAWLHDFKGIIFNLIKIWNGRTDQQTNKQTNQVNGPITHQQQPLNVFIYL